MSTEVMTNPKLKTKTKMTTKTIAQIGMLGALAGILMFFEIPLPFAPSFYQIDFSEVPVLIGAFSMGPMAGALIELVKLLVHFVIKGSSTAGVGDVANFLIGCALCLPAAAIYRKFHTRKGAVLGMLTGTAFMTIIGCFLNAYILLPAYSKAFELPIDALIGMGTQVNGNITGLFTFVVLAVAPFNLLKGVMVSAVVFLIYKKISPVLKMAKRQ